MFSFVVWYYFSLVCKQLRPSKYYQGVGRIWSRGQSSNQGMLAILTQKLKVLFQFTHSQLFFFIVRKQLHAQSQFRLV